MKIENLILLRDHVAQRDPETFDQNEYPWDSTECGCVHWNHMRLFGKGLHREHYAISDNQMCYIFGNADEIKHIAMSLELQEPDSFGPVDAAVRIQQVMDGEVG